MPNFLEKRKAELENKIQTQYDLLHQTEEQRDNALLPVEKQRLELEIKRIKTLIEGYEKDYKEVCRKIADQTNLNNQKNSAEKKPKKEPLNKPPKIPYLKIAIILAIIFGVGYGIYQYTQTLSKNNEIPELETFEINGVKFEMIYVEGGKFMMGCDNKRDEGCYNGEFPVHEVELDEFYIGRTEVTQEQWSSIMDTNPSEFKNCPTCPVEQVSWNDCQEFLKRLNQKTGKKYTLPTEAQWEYAARGGQKSQNFVYAGSNNYNKVAWCCGSGNKVATKKPNELDIYDMSGNVWEWCLDFWDIEFYKTMKAKSRNPINNDAKNFVVLRGGSWGDATNYCRIAYRGYHYPSYRNRYFGFRLCLGK